jgi:hypothetical protein
MRTTLNLDKDVLDAAKALAEKRRVPVGEVVSELARRGLSSGRKPAQTRNGFKLFSAQPNSPLVTPELVKELLEETD